MIKLRRTFSVLLVLLALTFLVVQPSVKADEGEGGGGNLVTVNVTAIIDDTNDDVTLFAENLEYGSNILLNYGSLEPDHFQFWIVNGVIRQELPVDHTFVATTAFEAIAVYSSGDHVHVYVDHSGKHLETKYGVALETKPVPPAKVGYAHNGYNEVTNGLVTVYRAKYTLTNLDKVEVNDIEYNYNEIVTLELPEKATHWERLDGKVVSYNDEFKLSALTDFNVVAGYNGIKENLVTFRQVDGFNPNLAHTYISQLEILPGYELIEYGLVDNLGAKRPASNLHNVTNEFIISSNSVFTKAYMVLKHNDKLITVYNHDLGALKEYTFNFTVDGVMGSPSEIYVMGDFNGWDFDTAADWKLTGGPYTLEGKKVLGHVGQDIYFKYAGGVGVEFFETTTTKHDNNNRHYKLTKDILKVDIVHDNDSGENITGWPIVEQEYTINLTINAPEGSPETLYIAGNHNNWTLTPIANLVKNGDVYTTTIVISNFVYMTGEPAVTVTPAITNGSTLEFKLATSNNYDYQANYVADEGSFDNDNRTYTFTYDNIINTTVNIHSWRGFHRVYFENDAGWPGPFRIGYWGNNVGTSWSDYKNLETLQGNIQYYDIPVINVDSYDYEFEFADGGGKSNPLSTSNLINYYVLKDWQEGIGWIINESKYSE